MTNEEILEQQVEALEKLLKLKQAIIEELESKVNKLEMEKIGQQPFQPFAPWVQPFNPLCPPAVHIPSVWQVDPCPTDGLNHDYPSLWNGTTSPSCSKCGKQNPLGNGLTISSNSGSISIFNPKEEDSANLSATTAVKTPFTLTSISNKK